MTEHESRLEHATESTLAKVLSRYLTPLLLSVVAWFGVHALNNIQEGQVLQAGLQVKQSAEIAEVKSDLKLLNAKVDYSLLQQVTDLQRRVELLESRAGVLRSDRP